MKPSIFLVLLLSGSCAPACELCAIYNAANATRQSSSGFSFTISEQYIPYNVSQFQGQAVTLTDPSYVDSSITHLVPAYNFSSRLGVSLNLPLTYLNFKRTDLRYSPDAPPTLEQEKGTAFGLGDTALIGRWAVVQKNTMQYGLAINLLAGVKFPTGDSSRIRDEVDQSEIFQSFLPPGTPHDPLSHSITSVHQHMLALGSGSYDGVFGLTENAHWGRWLLNGQFQYYLRAKGAAGFQFGDEFLVSGGPGFFLLLGSAYTLSLQANAVYDEMGRDRLLGQASDRTGSRAWYLGPLFSFTWGDSLSVTAGVDVPLHIANNGFQSVPAYRVNGGISYRF